MRLPYLIRRAKHSGRLQRANVRPVLAVVIAIAGLVTANAALGGSSTKLGLWAQSTLGPAQLGVTQQVLSDFASPGGSTGTFTTYTVPSTPYQIMLAVGNLNSSQASTIGNALVSSGHADTIFRVMVEENQATWNTSWNENVFTTGAAYATAFDNVVTELRAVPGNAFTFAWNPNGDPNISTANAGNNINGISTVSQYPGDGFVDYIGGDTYDHYGGGLGGASELLAFAQAHGKQYIIPEWGLNGTDNTTFMSNMISFIGSSTPVVQAYFSCACSTNSDLSQFPNSRALYTAAFGSSTTTTTAATGPPHVMVVMMENKNYTDVIGQSNQPFTNSLATSYGLATQSYAVNHPSLPNYLDIVSGQDPANSTDDGPPSAHTYSFSTVSDQLHTAGISEKAYAENLPADPTNDSGNYAVRHNPWEYFPANVMPVANSSNLVGDLNGASPPSFVWYTPNLINDEHDGTVQQGDAFLASFIPAVQATSWYASGGQIILTWDESNNDNSHGGGRVATIVISAGLAGLPTQSSSFVSTTGILHSIEDAYGLAHLGGSSADGTIDSLLNVSGPPPTTITTGGGSTTTNGSTSTSASTTTTTSPTFRIVSFTASTTSPSSGQQVTLTATANLDLWTTPSPYDMAITDPTGKVIALCGNTPPANVSLPTVCTAKVTSTGTQNYRADIGNDPLGNSTTLSTRSPLQATAGPLAITWPPPTTTTTGSTTTTSQPTTTTTMLPAPYQIPGGPLLIFGPGGVVTWR